VKGDNALGTFCYCLVEQHAVPIDILDYFRSKTWEGMGLEELAWALLAVGNLIDTGHSLGRVQRDIVEQIYDLLRNSTVVGSIMGEPKRQAEEFSSLELALAAFALKHQGFDQFIGFPAYQENALQDLVQLRNVLLDGGVILSRRWFNFFQVATLFLALGVSGWISWQLGINAIYSLLLELVVGALLIGLGGWYFNKGKPATEMLSEIFGAETENWSEDISNE
jgi:hypothetical protein